MLRAAIVDDEAEARKIVRHHLEQLADDLGVDLECREYPNGVGLLLEPVDNLDILFIDMEMPHMTGLQTASEVRAKCEQVAIVFVTAFAEYAVEGYSVRANRYLLKPLDAHRFRREIGPLVSDVAVRQQETVPVKCTDGTHVVEVRNIVYVATAPSKANRVRTVYENLLTSGTLAKWQKLLPTKSFARCHSGYLVNLAFVERTLPTEVHLTTGETLPLSKHRRPAFMEALASYLGGNL